MKHRDGIDALILGGTELSLILREPTAADLPVLDTTQIHVVERWKLAADGKTVDVTVHVEDPGAFTTPWKAIQRWRRVEDAPILTVPCNENNGDFFNQGLVPLAEAKTPDF